MKERLNTQGAKVMKSSSFPSVVIDPNISEPVSLIGSSGYQLLFNEIDEEPELSDKAKFLVKVRSVISR